MNLIHKTFKKFRTLILYGIIGCLSSSIDFLVYTLLVTYFGFNYIASNCISVLTGIITSFTLNRKYNFKVKDRKYKRFIIFLCVGLCGMMISNGILYLCIDVFQLHELISKLLSIVFVVLAQFIINKYITFKTR